MPRDSAGNYTLPAGYLAVTGQTVLASQHNPPLEDLGSAMTGSLPRNGSAPMVADLPMGNFKITGLGAGSAGSDAATYSQVQNAAPIGSGMDYWGTTAPAGWMFAYGQAISRTTYAALFAVFGTTYGVGDGSTTFNLPDRRGRVSAGKDNMGGVSAARLTAAVNGDILGAVGGSETHTLTAAQAPANMTGTTSIDPGHTHTYTTAANQNGFADGAIGGFFLSATAGITGSAGAHSHTVTVNSGGGSAHNNIQPTIICNYIIRVA